VENRSREGALWDLPPGVRFAGRIPEDELVRSFDAQGTALWDLPNDTPALLAADAVVDALGLAPEGGA
jgi:hypothetical protein